MSYIDPDLLHGEYNNLITFIGKTENAAVLTSKGVNPATVSAGLTAGMTDLSSRKTARDDKKTQLATAQQTFAASAATNYTAFSSAVDLVSGAMGKDTPSGQQVLNCRKHVTGSDQHASAAKPVAAPKP